MCGRLRNYIGLHGSRSSIRRIRGNSSDFVASSFTTSSIFRVSVMVVKNNVFVQASTCGSKAIQKELSLQFAVIPDSPWFSETMRFETVDPAHMLLRPEFRSLGQLV